MKKFVNTYFYLRPHKKNKAGLVPIYCRITVEGRKKEFSINQKIVEELWDSKKQRVKGTKESVRTINHQIDTIDLQIAQTFNELFTQHKDVSLEQLVNRFTNQYANETVMKKLDQIVYEKEFIEMVSKGRVKRLKVVKGKLQSYFTTEMKRSDIGIHEITIDFFNRFKKFLSDKGLKENTAAVYLKVVKMITKKAYADGIIGKNPLSEIKLTCPDPPPRYLTEEEVQRIMNVEFPSDQEYLNLIRDIFVFACFTGVAYCDLKNLKSENIGKGIDNKKWISYSRQKTGIDSKLRLMPFAKNILDKYRNSSNVNQSDKLFDVPSNQKMNDYLKLVGTAAGISKPLTTHMARHTYATIALTTGMSLETVGSTLGHKNLRTTGRYAQVVERKIKDEMDLMEKKITKTFKMNN